VEHSLAVDTSAIPTSWQVWPVDKSVYCSSESVLVIVTVSEVAVDTVVLCVERVVVKNISGQMYCMVGEASAADPVEVEK
jgi:hypothetical protein